MVLLCAGRRPGPLQSELDDMMGFHLARCLREARLDDDTDNLTDKQRARFEEPEDVCDFVLLGKEETEM